MQQEYRTEVEAKLSY